MEIPEEFKMKEVISPRNQHLLDRFFPDNYQARSELKKTFYDQQYAALPEDERNQILPKAKLPSGSQFRKARESMGWTQSDVARRCRDAGTRIPQSQISNIENGRCARSLALEHYARVLRKFYESAEGGNFCFLSDGGVARMRLVRL
jgi:hypothetical protein